MKTTATDYICELVDRLIAEFGLGTFTRPDSSGIRGGDSVKRASQLGGADFPYDTDARGTYGEPAMYDRGSKGHGPSHGTIVPHDQSWESRADDPVSVDRFENEAMGTPTNFSISGRGGQMPTGIPGATGGWAGPPRKPWDGEDDELGEGGILVGAGPGPNPDQQGDEPFDPRPLPPERLPHDLDADSDDDPLDHDGSILTVGTPRPFMAGIGRGFSPMRGLNPIPEDSAWSDAASLVASSAADEEESPHSRRIVKGSRTYTEDGGSGGRRRRG